MYSEITVKVRKHLKPVKITLNIFAVWIKKFKWIPEKIGKKQDLVLHGNLAMFPMVESLTLPKKLWTDS